MKISPSHIKALLLQEYYITRHSTEIFFDNLIFPVMNVLLFGFIAHFVSEGGEAVSSQYLILGVLLWEVITLAQYSTTISTLWSVWSHNLSNIFIAPISLAEYILAHMTAATIKAVGALVVFSIGSYFFFNFNLLDVGLLNLVLFVINLLIFGFWVGYLLLGLVFRYGPSIQAIAWGVIFLFQPLTASFFPVSVLPPFLRAIAYCLPPTYVFEAARQAYSTQTTNWSYIGIAFALNTFYSIVAGFGFIYLFNKSKNSGQFARNDL